MKKFNIGLDFGTYQSKVCVLDLDKDVHEFIKFKDNKFFLPSRVALKKDGTFEYGEALGGGYDEEIRYFKMASAEDSEFHIETDGPNLNNHSKYDLEEFGRFTPEFISVIYLTQLLLFVQESIKSSSGFGGLGTGLLGRLMGRVSQQEEIEFTVQLGIPTEWSHKKNLRRKRKFENILLLAKRLQDLYKTSKSFLLATSDMLLGDVKNIQSKLEGISKDEFESELNQSGLSVFPETAAGLSFLLNTKQLFPGFYAVMDVGAGTTDISFFRVMPGNAIKYYASESYIVAANDLYRLYGGESKSGKRVYDIQNEVNSILQSKVWQKNKKLVQVLVELKNLLNKKVSKLFVTRVRQFHTSLIEEYRDQTILLYGGGAQLPRIRNGRIEVYLSGSSNSFKSVPTNLIKRGVQDFTSGVNILPDKKQWESDFPLLVVALGLSYVKHRSAAAWFDLSDYHASDDETPKLVSHPFNEDCYIYDVLNSSWS